MIKAFRCKETEKIFRRFLPSCHRRFKKQQEVDLSRLGNRTKRQVPQGNHLEALKGDREGQYSIRINDQWRICFEWQEGNAYGVEIVD
jgi:proteic killer suppression protein